MQPHQLQFSGAYQEVNFYDSNHKTTKPTIKCIKGPK